MTPTIVRLPAWLLCATIATAPFSDGALAADGGATGTAAGKSAIDDNTNAVGAAIRRILHLMHEGDAKTLFELYQSAQDPIVHAWAAMAVERTRFNLDAATHDARLCEEKLSATEPAIALLCGQFEAGDLRLAGRWQAAHDKEVELARDYRDRHVEQRVAALQKYLEQEGEIAQPSLSFPATGAQIALHTDSSRPEFDATANGHEFKLMLDTGATDLVLGEDDARRFGVKVLDQTGHMHGWLSKDIPVQRGVLDTLQVDKIVWRNVPVRIISQRIALLGANLVAPLGTLRITRKALEISGADATAAACTDPMTVGTDLHGRDLRILPALQVNDAMQSVLLDTGSARFLLGTKAALDEVTLLERKTIAVGDVGGRHAFASAETAKVRMTISGQPFRIYFTVLTESDARHAITLGADALRDMDFLLDFRHQHLCFPLHAGLH